jgi:putative membrane protein
MDGDDYTRSSEEHIHMRIFMRPAAAGILTLALFAACKRDRDQSAAGSLDNARASLPPVDTFTAAAPAVTTVKWSSPNAIGFAIVANSGEVALGRLAQRKARSREVRAFATTMIADHSAMLTATKKLGSKLNVTADTTAGDARDFMSHDRDALQELTDAPAGADWDKKYMDTMIDGHNIVLANLQDAAKTTPDPQVRVAFDAAAGKVQRHLARAQDIRVRMK